MHNYHHQHHVSTFLIIDLKILKKYFSLFFLPQFLVIQDVGLKFVFTYLKFLQLYAPAFIPPESYSLSDCFPFRHECLDKGQDFQSGFSLRVMITYFAIFSWHGLLFLPHLQAKRLWLIPPSRSPM